MKAIEAKWSKNIYCNYNRQYAVAYGAYFYIDAYLFNSVSDRSGCEFVSKLIENKLENEYFNNVPEDHQDIIRNKLEKAFDDSGILEDISNTNYRVNVIDEHNGFLSVVFESGKCDFEVRIERNGDFSIRRI